MLASRCPLQETTLFNDAPPGVPPSSADELSCDVLVVGGGINGCGIARDAAGRGLKVFLCEQDDIAAHTSSWSSKLIHGGLRYLEQYHFRLVRESLQDVQPITAVVRAVIGCRLANRSCVERSRYATGR